MTKNKKYRLSGHNLKKGYRILPSPFSFLSSIFFLLPSTLFPATLTVKQNGIGDYTKIQDAIDAAAINDTILVWPGTYYENISFFGKDLVLASLYLTTGDRQYINQTIIDGNKNGSVITLQDNETFASVICGFTIQNGKKDFNSTLYEYIGSGIAVYYAEVKIMNNINGVCNRLP